MLLFTSNWPAEFGKRYPVVVAAMTMNTLYQHFSVHWWRTVRICNSAGYRLPSAASQHRRPTPTGRVGQRGISLLERYTGIKTKWFSVLRRLICSVQFNVSWINRIKHGSYTVDEEILYLRSVFLTQQAITYFKIVLHARNAELVVCHISCKVWAPCSAWRHGSRSITVQSPVTSSRRSRSQSMGHLLIVIRSEPPTSRILFSA